MGEIKFERLSLEKGLSQSYVYTIFQDREGFLWFATQEGLNRFDGFNFKVFKNKREDKRSLANNYVKAIFEDRKGDLWIGCMKDNLSVYNKEAEHFYNINLDDNPSIPKCALVTAVFEDTDGSMLIGTFDSGLKRYDRNNNSVIHYLNKNNEENYFANEDISCLLPDCYGNIWIGTWTEGVFILDKSKNSIYNLNDVLNKNDSIPKSTINCLYEDSDKNIWICKTDGLSLFNTSNQSLDKCIAGPKHDTGFLEKGVICVAQDRNKNIWIGSSNSGVYKIDCNKKITQFCYDEYDIHSLSSNSILSMYVDRSNVLWIGTRNAGICKTDCERKKFFNITKIETESGVNNEVKGVTSIYKDKMKRLWIGTARSGMHMFDNGNGDPKNINLKANKSEVFSKKIISGITEDSESNIWFSILSGNELIKYDCKENLFKTFNTDKDDGIYSVVNHNNNLLLGTVVTGILNFDTENEVFEMAGKDTKSLSNLSPNSVVCILKDSKNTLWIGTMNEGLFRYEIENDILTNYRNIENDPGSISDNFITCLYEDSKKNIWIGTYSGGLNKLDTESGKFTNYRSSHGLHDNIKGILEDENNFLWLSTNSGIYKFDPSGLSVKNYDVTDGLQSSEFNDGAFFKDKDGKIYFGGINGVTYFKPEEIKDNPHAPKVVITDFEIFNETVTGSPNNPFLKKNIIYADQINLTYRESVFSFRFTALIFNNPQKNHYAYMMEGFDKDWTYCGIRKRVTYTNLDPGEYIFKVKASNNDGVWNEEGTSVKIKITPPYWKTLWFKSLGILSLVAATGYSYRQRLEKLKKESEAQEEFSRKLIESQESERKRIAHELHDGIAHDVLISKNKALLALKHRDNKERMEKALEEISEQASATITEVRNIAYDLHPHQLERLGFTKTIKSIINEVSKSTDINFTFETDNVDEVLSKESEINLFRVVQEAISNIIKHSRATEAILKVSRFEDHLLIMLIDNGRGFEVNSKNYSEAKQGFGISGIMERIKFMNGEIRVESEINKGTTLKFKIPFKK